MAIDTITGYNSNNIYTNGYGSGNDITGAFGEIDNDTFTALQLQNQRRKNGQNHYQTVEGMKVDFNNKLMQQIGQSKG
ncbi:hypothetical protein IB241_07330 [Pseudomonas sp. PDM05]|jgi:hypothetical protein|uniref:hypothetical protein n=1 Tax=Pseudomonas sp. PDM05 TaxID=2769301 RepID=UPI0017842E80|nr:hypothetical protein [Pseudomonas sp. PDM05]MBD9457486.1 hypothetical protein [Pseudomonas sp. PDM05]